MSITCQVKQHFSSHIYIMLYILINNLIPSSFLLVLGGPGNEYYFQPSPEVPGWDPIMDEFKEAQAQSFQD